MTKLEKKYEELVVYLKALTISHSSDEEYENRLLAEIAILKEQQESKEQETAEEILNKVHNIERMSACMEDSYVLKRTAIRSMQEYHNSKISEELMNFAIECNVSRTKEMIKQEEIDEYLSKTD